MLENKNKRLKKLVTLEICKCKYILVCISCSSVTHTHIHTSMYIKYLYYIYVYTFCYNAKLQTHIRIHNCICTYDWKRKCCNYLSSCMCCSARAQEDMLILPPSLQCIYIILPRCLSISIFSYTRCVYTTSETEFTCNRT